MCARCLKEGMFLPKTRRGKRLNNSAEEIITTDSNLLAPTRMIPIESNVDSTHQTSSSTAAPPDDYVPDSYYSSGGEELKESFLPFVVGIVVTISLILTLFGRRLGE